ncbi:hypothetical protein AX15_001843 [Amanita polypyramis BW_CC]|nr:hypothetical protein AX15_001843 [Amanita polypyramis BW_CC]
MTQSRPASPLAMPRDHPQTSQADSELIADLSALAKRSPKLVKSSVYPAPADPAVIVRSWKMNEFKYYDIPSPFPTYARGIFTVELPGEQQESVPGTGSEAKPAPRYRIAARGYDKFFNIGEVPWTEWPFLESHTRPPYVLSLKSNGCIIFIGALTPSKLLVTSKHSIGPVAGQARSHAQVGETWLRRYIERKGRTEADLAKQLWDNNWTAVAELCDDSFEEHVLPYPPEKTGLYLHGLNTCTKEFYTFPPATVDAFADEWGFIKTRYAIFKTIPEVRAFTDEVRKTGTWEGEPLEGFVVRTHITEPPRTSLGSTSTADATKGTLPYSPGSTFFFKIKFDEPYLMYRDWREVTKSLLSMQSKSGHMNPNNIPKSKMRRQETKVYVDWAIREIKHNPRAFAQYTNNIGIIKTREMFIEWLASNDGKKLHDTAAGRETHAKPKQEFSKTIIVPVAVPGCGKTAVSVALAHIFGFGHTQSDNVRKAKKPGPIFVQNVMSLLEKHDVVIADKNNHLRQHRTMLREESTNFFKKRQIKKQTRKGVAAGPAEGEAVQTLPRVRLLSLFWNVSSQQPSTVFRICAERVHTRGTNHQTLRANPDVPVHRSGTGSETYESVIRKFIHESEELSPSEVDAIIEMDLSEPLEQSVRRAVDGIVKEVGLPMPTNEKIQEGIEKVKAYKVGETDKKPDPSESVESKGGIKKAERKQPPTRYYGFLPDLDIESVLDPFFVSLGNTGASFWDHLKNGRIASRPHVTIVHKKELPEGQDLWDGCQKLVNRAGGLDVAFWLHLTHVLWDGRVMALTVDDLAPAGGDEDMRNLASQLISSLTEEQRKRLHVTVGTKEAAILPVEAKSLVEGWRNGEKKEKVQGLELGKNGIMVKASISGL